MLFKKNSLLWLLLLFPCVELFNQSAFEQGNADYIIPEPIALQAILENTPSLMNPSTVRTYTVSLGADGSDNRGIYAAGIEAAPFSLFKTFDLSKYLSGRLIRVLLRTRLSFSAQLNPQNGFRGVFGFRWMAHDDADLRSDSAFQRQLSKLGSGIGQLRKECEGSSNYQMCLAEGYSRLGKEQQTIDSLRQYLKNKFWNGSVFEFAFTGIYSSDDKNPDSDKIQQWNIYLNAALPITTIGQNVFGITGWMGRDNNVFRYQRALAIMDRAAFGNPGYRYFGELKYILSSIFKPDCTFGIGGFYHLYNGLGIQADASISFRHGWNGREGHIVLSYAVPEIK